jgi:hypothetical protein
LCRRAVSPLAFRFPAFSARRGSIEDVGHPDAEDGAALSKRQRPAFVAWGFNYDHDEKGRLLEDYWTAEWPKVEEDFHEMKELGANVVRVHLQVGKFMRQPDAPNDVSLDRLLASWNWRSCTCTWT